MPPGFAWLAQSAYYTPDPTTLGASPAEAHGDLHAYARASKTVFVISVPLI